MADKGIVRESKIMKDKGKEKGIESFHPFFESAKQQPYQSKFELLGQSNKDSCVATTTRMLLSDFGIKHPEAFISSILDMNDGAYLSKVPAVLKEFGLEVKFQFRNNLTFEELTQVLLKQKAVVSVKRRGAKFGHALIIDDIIDTEVQLRDPLPLGFGKSYAVSIEDFKEVWLRDESLGIGVIYDDK